jgi:predicted RNA-binding Zn-ribbon protein involved in translation (DUF1610 family)
MRIPVDRRVSTRDNHILDVTNLLTTPHIYKMKSVISTHRRTAWIVSILIATTVAVIAATYTYKCPKCGLIQSYSRPNPGVKCPNDGWSMVSQ